MEPISVKEILSAVNGQLLYGEENRVVTSVSTNSKEINQDTLFVPIIGERVDAHQFIDGALNLGAVATFTSKMIKKESFLNNKSYILVEDTLKALQALGAYYRNKFHIPVIGITGSVGKTTTKEMIAAALETKYNVLKTAGNMNSQIGLPLTMFRIEKQHEVAVIEMGMSEEGEMAKLAKIARPNIAVMTNIGVSHIGQLKTRENIRKEKLNIINEFPLEGTLYINGDDELLIKIKDEMNRLHENQNSGDSSDTIDITKETKEKLKDSLLTTYGTKETSDFKAADINTVNGETHFTLKFYAGNEEVAIRVLGVHNVFNASVALAIADSLGISPMIAKKGLYEYMPIAMRGQIHEVNHIKLIDDTYNASPDSMKGGIGVLLELENVDRRIAVLADVLELGEISYQCHYEVGEFIASKNIHMVVTIGKEAKAIKEAIDKLNPKIRTVSFEQNKEAIEYLQSVLKEKDAVLVKGSRGMKTDEIIKAFVEA